MEPEVFARTPPPANLGEVQAWPVPPKQEVIDDDGLLREMPMDLSMSEMPRSMIKEELDAR